MDPRMRDDVESTATIPETGGRHGRAADPGRPLTPAAAPEWLQRVREGLSEPGHYLAYEDSQGCQVVPLRREVTRVGRSLSAELRFDDATVSRRHAVLVCGGAGARILDDRSLNGVYVNGMRTHACELRDGDEIVLGRHSLWFLDTARAAARPQPAAIGD